MLGVAYEEQRVSVGYFEQVQCAVICTLSGNSVIVNFCGHQNHPGCWHGLAQTERQKAWSSGLITATNCPSALYNRPFCQLRRAVTRPHLPFGLHALDKIIILSELLFLLFIHLCTHSCMNSLMHSRLINCLLCA